MTKKLVLTALSLVAVLGLAAPAQAEIIDYGYGSQYGSSYYGYGSSYSSTYPYYGTQYGSSYGTLTRDLTIGSYGADVQALESFLRTRGFMTGTGTGYFSAATRDGVMRFQAAMGIFPVSGYVGAITRSYVNAQMGGYGSSYPNYGTGYPYGQTDPYGNTCPSNQYPVYYGGQMACVKYSSSSHSGSLNGGRASLDNFDISEGDDADTQEGDDDAELVQVSFDVDDGDAELTDAEFRFEYVGSSNGEDRPWETFDRIRLMADGDEIASIDASDSDEWDHDGDDVFTIRFEDLDEYVVDEGDEADLTLEADIASSIDGADHDRIVWEVSVPDDGIRVRDGDGHRTDIGDDGETVRVTIDED